jgi:hypothetical protein
VSIIFRLGGERILVHKGLSSRVYDGKATISERQICQARGCAGLPQQAPWLHGKGYR